MTFRIAGGALDVFFFSGPTPDAVLRDYHDVIGIPALPPRWALGFHVCRWGYDNLDAVKATQAALLAADIPVDVFWFDIDYMNSYRIFTTNAEKFPAPAVREWSDALRQGAEGGGGKGRFVIINDPGIASFYSDADYPAFATGKAANSFILEPTRDEPMIGHVWPGATAFADFTRDGALGWWSKNVADFRDAIGFDGLWLDMGEISSFWDAPAEADERRKAAPSPAVASKPDLAARAAAPPQRAAAVATPTDGAFVDLTHPPFLPGRRGGAQMLEEKTLPMTARTAWGPQYYTHSLFGLLEARATATVLRNLTGARPFIISRSTYPGQGSSGGHWLGDNTATWHDLRMSIPGVFNFHLFGVPLVGTDLCGFAGAASSGGATGMVGMVDSRGIDTELCARWYQLGALTYTFFRVHTMIGRPDQHPAAFDANVTAVIRDAIALRYSLVPYLYTRMARAAESGGAVVRPLALDFVAPAAAAGDAEGARALAVAETQAMIGGALLFSPVVESGVTEQRCLFPLVGPAGAPESWFEWRSGQLLDRGEDADGPWVIMRNLSLDSMPLHVRGGSIVPALAGAVSAARTTAVDNARLDVTVALADGASAAGDLFWDDGETLSWRETGAFFSLRADAGEGGATGSLAIEQSGGAALVQADAGPCVSRVRVIGATGVHAICEASLQRGLDVPADTLSCTWSDGALLIEFPECEPIFLGLVMSWYSPNDEL